MYFRTFAVFVLSYFFVLERAGLITPIFGFVLLAKL